MTRNSSRSEGWDRVRLLEDLLARLARARDRARVIRLQAWNEGDWETVFDEATRQGDELDWLRDVLSEKWYELHAAAQND